MAEVYLARDNRYPRDIALKIIRDELATAVGADRFLREISITARLSHPHIRPLLDSGEADGILYYAMPFVRGETLRDRMAREQQLGLEDALRIARDLADALDYAHSQGVVHRDVKPGNIFLESGHALLSDFGIAVLADVLGAEKLTASGIVIGTPEYLSPEQCEGRRRVDGRADIYALGCVLYELLTGQPPFTGRTRLAIIAKQISEPAPAPAILRPDLPVEVDDLLRRCLAKAPGDRWPTAAALRDSIDEALMRWKSGSSRGIAARGEPGSRLRTRVTAVAAAGGVVTTVAVLWALATPPFPTLDPNKVVVFPLADRTGGGDPIGSAVAMMIGNALIHADPLKAIDAWDYLTGDQRNDPATVSPEDQRAVALGRRAGFFVTGGLTRQRDTIAVLLTLHDTRGDSIVARSSYQAASGDLSPDQIGTRAMIDLLPTLVDPGRKVDMTILTERDPAAVYRWIRGDLEYRNARFTAALEHYRAAVEADSLLAFAALKGAQAASWSERPELAIELARHAAANDSILPLRYRHFARGLLAYLEGRADDAVTAFQAAVREDPEWAEAWMALGEVYHHLLPTDLATGTSAPEFFEQAASHDPAFAPPLVHLIEYALRGGATDRAGELVGRLRAAGAEGAARLAAMTLVMDCAARGASRERWLAVAQGDANIALEAAQQLAAGAYHLDCAEAGFRSMLDQPDLARNLRGAATIGLQSVLVAGGRAREAQALLDEQLALGLSLVRFLVPLDALAGADMVAGARQVEQFADSMWAPSYLGIAPRTLWLIGAWKAHVGETAALDTIRNRIAAAASQASSPHTELISKAIEARAALLADDTATAVRLLRSLRATGTRPELLIALYEAFPAERILLAELLLATGEHEEAYWMAATLDHPQPLLFTTFVPKSLAIRRAAASALPGPAWSNRAEDARRRLDAMGRSELLPAPRSTGRRDR